MQIPRLPSPIAHVFDCSNKFRTKTWCLGGNQARNRLRTFLQQRTVETKARTTSIHPPRPKTLGHIFNPQVVEPVSTRLEGISGALTSSNSSAARSQSRRTFLSHLARARGWFHDVFMLFSVKCNFMMRVQCWVLTQIATILAG